MLPFRVVIPARYASTRLPGKPLLEINGRPMTVHVAERAKASGATSVCVATDHEEIADAVRQHGFDVVMTRSDHPTGTDRIAEVVQVMSWGDEEIIVNVQGDEPLISPDLIRSVAINLDEHQEADIATACHPVDEIETLFNPHVVKVVLNQAGYALYFSRAPIPWARDEFAKDNRTIPLQLPVYRHVGLYAYRARFLKDYSQLESAYIEQFEALEQLRALWHGYKISVAITKSTPAPGVDTADDLEKVRRLLIT